MLLECWSTVFDDCPTLTQYCLVYWVLFSSLKRHNKAKIIKKSVIYFGFPSDMHVQNKKCGNFVSICRFTGKCTARKLKKTSAVLMYGHA